MSRSVSTKRVAATLPGVCVPDEAVDSGSLDVRIGCAGSLAAADGCALDAVGHVDEATVRQESTLAAATKGETKLRVNSTCARGSAPAHPRTALDNACRDIVRTGRAIWRVW